MKHSYEAHYNNLTLRPLEYQDIEQLRIWRNDRALCKYLRDIPEITPEMQKAWYISYINDKHSVFFAIVDDETNTMVGSMAIYNICEATAEIGKIFVGDRAARGKHVGYHAIVMAMIIGIEKIGIKRFMLECHADNIPALKSYCRAGFSEIGRHPFIKGGIELEMAIDAEAACKKNLFVPDIKVM